VIFAYDLRLPYFSRPTASSSISVWMKSHVKFKPLLKMQKTPQRTLHKKPHSTVAVFGTPSDLQINQSLENPPIKWMRLAARATRQQMLRKTHQQQIGGKRRGQRVV
jgi:hypothetical protein